MKLGVVLVISTCVSMIQACSSYDPELQIHYTWYCTFSCCYDYAYCCNNYWYVWTAASLVFLVCLAIGAGCGGYGYRRYVVHRTYHQPATIVTTTATTTSYQPQQGYGSAALPPYK